MRNASLHSVALAAMNLLSSSSFLVRRITEKSSGMAIESLRFRDVVSLECRLDVGFDATRDCEVSAALSD